MKCRRRKGSKYRPFANIHLYSPTMLSLLNVVNDVCNYRDGSLVASVSTDGLCRLWDFRTGHLLRTLQDSDSSPISTVRFSPNSHYLLESTVAKEPFIRIWDWRRNEGEVVRVFKGHRNAAYSLPAGFVHGTCVLAAAEDGTVSIWNVNTSKVSYLLGLMARYGVTLTLNSHGPSCFSDASYARKCKD
jgi:WD40 repeat protein